MISIVQNKTNPLWPQFEDAVRFEKTILMPELVSSIRNQNILSFMHISIQCLVLFAVNITVTRKWVAGTKTVLLGQNVFAFTSLQPGNEFEFNVRIVTIDSNYW